MDEHRGQAGRVADIEIPGVQEREGGCARVVDRASRVVTDEKLDSVLAVLRWLSAGREVCSRERVGEDGYIVLHTGWVTFWAATGCLSGCLAGESRGA